MQGLQTPAQSLQTPGCLAGWLAGSQHSMVQETPACVLQTPAWLISKHITSGEIYLIGLDIHYRCFGGIFEANHDIWPPLSQD